jgi:endonuclease-3
MAMANQPSPFSCGRMPIRDEMIRPRCNFMHKFTRTIQQLRKHYGEPAPPLARGPFELVMWENACYLLGDERRLEVFQALREQVGMSAAAIEAAPDRVLLPIAIRGGMRPEMRVFRWREIAGITLTQFGGDLDSILSRPYAEARKALKQFPTIGEPGAEKILLLCGIANGLPLESNGLRVLLRLGWGRSQKSYSATYRSVQEGLRPELPVHVERLKQAHLLLRIHGKSMCKETSPLCHQCPVSMDCRYAQTTAASFLHGGA